LQEHDAQSDREALEQLAMWCQRFSPVVGLETADEPSCLLLDVTGLDLLFGDEQTLSREVLQAFRQRGYSVRLAIADTVAAAWAVAHFGEDDPALVIPTGRNTAALSPLPIEALRLPDKTAKLLRQLGVCRIEQLARLPRTALSSRFGDQLLQRWNQATGALQEVIVVHHPPAPLEAQWTLEHPTTRRDAIDCVLQRLIGQLTELLARRNRGTIQLTCRLDCLDARSAHVQIDLFRPTAKAEHLLQLLGMQLDQLALPGPLHRILVQAIITAPLEDRQGELLDGAVGDSSRHLAKLVDRLSSRLGRDRVVGAQLLAEAQVERAYRDVPLTGQRPSPPASTAASLRRHTAAAGQRPLHLHPSPLPLDVIAVVPDGPPISFVWQNQRHSIRQHWGPERIETGWWRGRSVRRDYYRVEDQHGSRFWLFRQLNDGRWFLQGEFE
jgi:protein ImuB